MRKLSMIVTLCVMSLVGCAAKKDLRLDPFTGNMYDHNAWLAQQRDVPASSTKSSSSGDGLMLLLLGTQMMNQRPAAPPPSAVCHTIKSGVTYQTICQ